jgi:dipeptidyl aminopeptidase/acylaminoacyl peptidase
MDIFVMNADGGNVRKLTSNGGNDLTPAWSPDGTKMAFTLVRFGAFPDSQIYVMNADGSGQVNISGNTRGGSPAWNPQGATATAAPPLLLTDENSDRALAFDSVTMMRDPFPLVTRHNFSPDGRTRIMLLARNVDLRAGEALTAQLEDAQRNVYPLTVESVGKVPNFAWLTQVVVKLPAQFANTGNFSVSITLRGAASNKASIAIKPGSQ